MQMRNLLKLIGSLALTTGVATSVVACGHQTGVNLDTILKNKELGEIPVVDTEKPTEQELKNAIKAVPENKDINLDGIKVKPIYSLENFIVDPSGSFTGNFKPIVSATFAPDYKIYKGDEITVTFTLVHKKTDVEVTNDIKLDLKNVDGSSLNSSQKQSDANDVIKAAIKKVTDADNVDGETTFTFVNGKTVLTKGNNEVAIKVTFGESKDVAITVNLTNVAEHKKTDVEVSNINQ